MSPVSEDDARAEYECDVCGEDIPVGSEVEHPAYSEVFCSKPCKDRFLNRLRGGWP